VVVEGRNVQTLCRGELSHLRPPAREEGRFVAIDEPREFLEDVDDSFLSGSAVGRTNVVLAR
jgi:hypothetical protein